MVHSCRICATLLAEEKCINFILYFILSEKSSKQHKNSLGGGQATTYYLNSYQTNLQQNNQLNFPILYVLEKKIKFTNLLLLIV